MSRANILMSPKQSSLIFTMPRYCNTLPIRLLRKLRRIFIVLQLNNRPVRGKILLLPPTIQQKFFWENALSILEKAPAKCAEAKIIFLRSFYIKYFFRKNFSEKKSAR